MKIETTEREKGILQYLSEKESRLQNALLAARQEIQAALSPILQRGNGVGAANWTLDEDLNIVSPERGDNDGDPQHRSN